MIMETLVFQQFEKDGSMDGSPYAWRGNLSLSVCSKPYGNPLDAVSLRKSGKLGRGIRVLDALYKYPFLDRCSLLACLSAGRSFDGIGDRQLWDHLRFLIRSGLAESISYGDFHFYRLSEDTRKQMSDYKGYIVEAPTLSNVSFVLETAALCSWHAHATAGGNCGRNAVFQKMRFAKKEIVIDSYLELKRTVRYRIFAFSTPRGSDPNAFVNKILDSWRLQCESGRKGQVTLTLVVASSLTEMEGMDRLFGAIGEARGRKIHYALDSRRGRDAYGFHGIYYFDSDGVENSLRSVSID